jgi:hypothetical protein
MSDILEYLITARNKLPSNKKVKYLSDVNVNNVALIEAILTSKVTEATLFTWSEAVLARRLFEMSTNPYYARYNYSIVESKEVK